MSVKFREYDFDTSILPSSDPEMGIRLSIVDVVGKHALLVGPLEEADSEGFRLIATLEGLNAVARFEGFGQLALTSDRLIGMINSGVLVALHKKKGEERREKKLDESKASVLVFSMLRKDVNKVWRIPSTDDAPGGVVVGTSQANNPSLWLRVCNVSGLVSDDGEVSTANTDEFFSWVCSNTSAIFT